MIKSYEGYRVKSRKVIPRLSKSMNSPGVEGQQIKCLVQANNGTGYGAWNEVELQQ
jgi:hypothetical protein